jgi:CRP/FNR family transcriptional regulator
VEQRSESSAVRANEDTQLRVRRAFERSFEAGQTVFDEGDSGEVLYVIQSGMIELIRSGPDGPRLVARLAPGEFFGEMGVLLGQPRSVRAVAASPSRLIELDPSTFEEMCVAQPEIAIRVIQRLAARVIDLEQRLAALGVDDLLRPVVRVLVRRADHQAGAGRLATTLRRLAGEAGLSLLEAHRALSQLMERRLVRLVDDVLVIPDLEALSGCLDGVD